MLDGKNSHAEFTFAVYFSSSLFFTRRNLPVCLITKLVSSCVYLSNEKLDLHFDGVGGVKCTFVFCKIGFYFSPEPQGMDPNVGGVTTPAQPRLCQS